MAQNTLIVILMGVSGSGKTTVGQLLANELGWPFYDGDDFHSQANIDKMRQGIALTDEDRKSWLSTLQQLIQELISENQSAVIACSALKQSYRDLLARNEKDVMFVYLKGDYELIRRRLLGRKDHFFNSNLLRSQFETLEEPEGALTIDTAQEPGAVVNQIKRQLGL